MQPLAEASGKLEHAAICHEHHNIARRVQDSGADLAGFKMAIDLGAQAASTSPSMYAEMCSQTCLQSILMRPTQTILPVWAQILSIWEPDPVATGPVRDADEP
jgi:hypothetical protein